LDPASVEKKDLGLAGEPRQFGDGQKGLEKDAGSLFMRFETLLEKTAAKHRRHAIGEGLGRRSVQAFPFIDHEAEGNLRKSESVGAHQPRGGPQLTAVRSQKFLSRRQIEEEIANHHGGARCPAYRLRFLPIAAFDLDPASFVLTLGSGLDDETRGARNGRQCLAAKPQCLQSLQIIDLEDFAGGVCLERERQFVARDPDPVVGDLELVCQATPHRDLNPMGAGVERVFKDFL
jgi:hypothetical protein